MGRTSAMPLSGRAPMLHAMTYVDLEPDDHREVTVQHSDGLRYPGHLKAYRKVEGVWKGYVRYTTAPSETRLAWFEEGRIRGGGLG
jgi:hypothetical protein